MTAYIGLGSNLGDREAYLRRGIEALPARGICPSALSGVWDSAPVDCRDPHRFLNMVARVETTHDAERLLGELLAIEREAGRVRRERNAPRTLDLDLLLVGDRCLRLPHLVVPHPRMWSRRFVLAPLAEVAPDLRDPASGRTVAELELELRREQPDVRRVGSLPTAA